MKIERLGVPVLDADDRSRIAARGQHRIPQNRAHTAVSVWIGVGVSEQPVYYHGANARLGFHSITRRLRSTRPFGGHLPKKSPV
jgi:hypothetical protein